MGITSTFYMVDFQFVKCFDLTSKIHDSIHPCQMYMTAVKGAKFDFDTVKMARNSKREESKKKEIFTNTFLIAYEMID